MKRALFAFALVICLLFSVKAFSGREFVIHIQTVVQDEEGRRLSAPSFVFADPVTEEVYVTSRSRVILYTSDFFPLLALDKNRNLQSPYGAALDGEGNLFVVQGPLEKGMPFRISVFNASLMWERDIEIKGFEGVEDFKPSRIALDGEGRMYLVASFFPGVPVLEKDGKVLEVMAPTEKGNKVGINDVAVGEDGRIYILSADSAKVYVYDGDHELLFSFGRKGGSSGKMSRPVGVAVDDRFDRIYVVDYMRHTVLVFTKEGNYLTEFGGMGWSDGWFQFPNDIEVDSLGRVIVADTFNNRVQVFGPVGFHEQ
ncbi:MAG: NHL repeat-containing protein [Nitrospirota bacterium]|jgi:DNA-binding beta-propeller fold protein YncE